MEFIVLRSFDNYFYANITLTKLEDAGIACWLKDEHTVTIDPILSNAIGGIKLVVKDTDVEEAQKLLQHFDEEYMRSVKCPNCGANAITQISKPGVVNVITSLLTWLFSSYAVAPVQVYKCTNCGYESKSLPTMENEEE